MSFPTLTEKIDLNPVPTSFVQGMISTHRNPKDKSLDGFLNYIKTTGYIPQKITFVDDDIQNVQHIQTYCSHHKIPFIGIHYTKAKNLPIIQSDPNVFNFQYNTLLKEHRWVTYEHAIQMMHSIKM